MLSKDKIVSALAEGFQTWNGLGYSGQPLTVSFSFFFRTSKLLFKQRFGRYQHKPYSRRY